MYKKGLILVIFLLGLYVYCSHGKKVMEGFNNKRDCPNTVSYTHLTLPTILLV